MRFLFYLGHPAHFHLYKNIIFHLNRNKEEVYIAVRGKDIEYDLLDYYKLNYIKVGLDPVNKKSVLIHYLAVLRDLVRLQKQKCFDAAFGAMPALAQIGFFCGFKTFIFGEDDDDLIPLVALLRNPFATYNIRPECVRMKYYKKNIIRYSSYHELAYLHPDNFKPDKTVLKKYGLKENEYIVARFSALKAFHDKNERGISDHLWLEISELLSDYQIVKSTESSPLRQIEPWDMHHILAFAKMLISDSQTMTMESAVLGVTALRINTFIVKSSVLEEIEENYHLSFGFFPEQKSAIFKCISILLDNPGLETEWREKKENMLKDKIDLNKWMIELVDSYMEVN